MGRPMEAAIDSALTTNYSVLDRRIAFRPASRPDNQDEQLRLKYKPLNTLAPVVVANGIKTSRYAQAATDAQPDDDNAPPRPRKIIFPPDRVAELMVWRRAGRAGAGLYNYGNTCFLNSVLQALTHTPPLANYLLSGEHSRQCRLKSSNCAMCEMELHVQASLGSTRPIKPARIVTKLKVWAKHFRKGRQEDAHEFLRYFTDAMQRACLSDQDAALDHASKATTLIHQVFGGYLRSQVKCTECGAESNTFDANLDISLDIKHARSVSRALAEFTKPEILDRANMYMCAKCKRKVVAHKRFTIHTTPAVLTIHLKRFDFTYRHGQKITRHVEFDEELDLAPYMSTPGSDARYRLAAVVVHAGHTVHSGHYFAYVRAPGGTWWCCDDDAVTTAALNTVLRQQAYMLVYTRVMPPPPAPRPAIAEKPAPLAEGVPEVGDVVRKEPTIVHVSAAENKRRRLVNCVARQGAWWEVVIDGQPGVKRADVLPWWEKGRHGADAVWTLHIDVAYRVEIAPTKRIAGDDESEEEEEEKAPNLPSTSPRQPAQGVRVHQWDATLGKDDLARRVRGIEEAPRRDAQPGGRWDGRAVKTTDVIGRLRDNKFSGFAGISTWEGAGPSLVETVDLGERQELFKYKYSKDDMEIDTGRTKKVKKPKLDGVPMATSNVFQAALDRKKAAKSRVDAEDDDRFARDM